MEFDFSFLERIEQKKIYNKILREKYKVLQQKEKEKNGGANRRITQVKMGKVIGVSDSYISLWTTGKREFDFPILEKVAAALLDEEWFLENK